MKLCVLGIDGATPLVALGDDRLVNMRRLMDLGLYGRLQGVFPPGTPCEWDCFAVSQDPASFGIYGPRSRMDRTYDPLLANRNSIDASTIVSVVKRAGGKAMQLDSTSQIDGVTDQASRELFLDRILAASRERWSTFHELASQPDWAFLQFVDSTLEQTQNALWEESDVRYYQRSVLDYHFALDEQIGTLLQLIDNETILLVQSTHGVQQLHGSFFINEWLVEQGLLVLRESPRKTTALEKSNVDWSKTRAWAEGGPCGQIFLNVEGREPQGTIPATEYESFRYSLKNRIESVLPEERDAPATQVLKPEEVCNQVNGVAPDLMVCVGQLAWNTSGMVGGGLLWTKFADGSQVHTPSHHGIFVLAAPNCPLCGEYEGARLLDMAPTLLDLAGYEIPDTMQGRSLLSGKEKKSKSDDPAGSDDQNLIRERLAGLGYI